MLSFTLKKGRNDITAGASRTQKAAYYALYYLLKAVGLLPAWFLYYPLAGVCYLLLYYLFRYRLQVTRENLQNAFPEKSREELRRIERRFYRHLAEVFIDTIDLTSISRRQLRRRMMIKDEAVHRKEVEGKDWIAGMSHYGSWEYFIAYALGDGEGRETIGVYKTLHNRVMDMLYRSIRSRMGMEPVPMSVILRHVVRDRPDGDRSHRRPGASVVPSGLLVRLSRSTDFVLRWVGKHGFALRHAGLFRTHRQDTAGTLYGPFRTHLRRAGEGSAARDYEAVCRETRSDDTAAAGVVALVAQTLET